MENALILFMNIMVMLMYSLPSFVLVKTKMLSSSHISGFNILLLYVTQPCLSYYAMTKAEFEPRILLNMLYTFLIALFVMLTVIFIYRAVTKTHRENVNVRIANIAIAFSNCTFMGIPLVEAMLPDYPEAVLYSVMFFIAMALIGWTVASYIITNDKKYISLKKVFINPATIGLIAALPFFLFSVRLPVAFHDAVSLLGKMSTPVSMFILGMRLATLSPKSVFADKSKYLTVFIRQIAVPLLYLFVCIVLPIENDLKSTVVICGSASVAAVVLNYAELLGRGSEYAAGTVVLSNLSAVITMPLIVLIENALIK